MAAQPTAILSVYNKTGLLDLAKGLHAKGVKLLGSGGTAKLVRDAGIEIGFVYAITAYTITTTHRTLTPHRPLPTETYPISQRHQRCSVVE